MSKNMLTIGGKDYPSRITMGAMMRFKNQTGHDISKMDGTDLTEMATFMWCCVKSSCMADGVTFDMDLEEFADKVDAESVTSFSAMLQSNAEKKTK